MIISASRRTDIPAFYSEWFINRIKEGYLIVRNPTNNKPYRIVLSPDIVDCIVFWTKNPIPMIPKLDELKEYMYYFQFTLTGYGKDIERNIPDKKLKMIPAFQELSEKIGPQRVIWRYDPVLINDTYTVDYHLKAFSQIAKALKGYTEKCVFSFVDIYTKNMKSMQALNVKSITRDEMHDIAERFRDIAWDNNMTIATCAENIDLDDLKIDHNACIDKKLIEKLTGGIIDDKKKYIKDAGQREECGCMTSKEIGAHNTCGNGCIYCYANYSPDSVKKSMQKYDPKSPILCDEIRSGEEVKDAADMKSIVNKNAQLTIF
jgi:Domain of unknown function (DUF1848).